MGWMLWGLMATMPRLSCDRGMSRARAALCWARTRRHAALLRRMLDTWSWNVIMHEENPTMIYENINLPALS